MKSDDYSRNSVLTTVAIFNMYESKNRLFKVYNNSVAVYLSEVFMTKNKPTIIFNMN